MPKLTVKIEGKGLEPLEASRKVENFADAAKLLALAQSKIRNAVRIFPSLKAAKIERVSVRAD